MSLIYSAITALDHQDRAQVDALGGQSVETGGSVKAVTEDTTRAIRSSRGWIGLTIIACVSIVGAGAGSVALVKGASVATKPHAVSAVLPDTQPTEGTRPETALSDETDKAAPSMPSALPVPVDVPLQEAVASPAFANDGPKMLPAAATAADKEILPTAANKPPAPYPSPLMSAPAPEQARPMRSAPASSPDIQRAAPHAVQEKAVALAPVAVVTSSAALTRNDNIDELALNIRRAVDGQRYEEAKTLIHQLAQQLPPESITLLRLRAWHALRSGDLQLAQTLYRGIAERLPDDEPASINLALSHWKLGQKEQARQIIASLAERRPESEAVRQAAAQFGGQS